MDSLSPAEKFAASRKRSSHPLSEKFASTFDFALDPFQIAGCQAVEEGKSVLVAAPTGAGKTVVGEFAAFSSLEKGKKCFYTTPIKALSNQKFGEFVKAFGEERVGLLTGDSAINSEAPIVVMTTEVLRNMLYAGSHTLTNLGAVVMDEVHYLADKFRGAVWEEVLIHLMGSVQVVSLSATVSNAEEFGEWLGEVRGETEVIVSEIRPIPLYQHVLLDNRLLDLFTDNGGINPDLLRVERETMRRVRTPRYRNDRRGDNSRLSRSEVIEKLSRESLLPAITFIFSRAGCDAAVRECLATNLRLTASEERDEIREIASRYTLNLAHDDLEVLGHRDWLAALERGIAAHHAGLLPSFKQCVEECFQKGLIKAVFATETLALGINMPARTVVLERLVKYNGEAHVPISAGEYTQLTGRAGRRGIDIEGNAVIQWSPTVDSAVAAGLASTRTYPLRSSFSPTYNMSINLMSQFGREKARNSLESSFAQFQADRAVTGLVRQIKRNDDAIGELVEQARCHLGDFIDYAILRREIKEVETLLSKRESRKTFDDRQRQRLVSDLDSLRSRMKSHACHSCHDREAHARFAERADRLRRENEGLRQRVESRTALIARTFDRTCLVLEQLGYIEAEKPTNRGALLAKVYAESDLLIAETISSHILNELTPEQLVSVLSALIYEGRKSESSPPRIPHIAVQNCLAEIVSIWAKLEKIESAHELKTQREPDFGFCWSIYNWCNGKSLTSVLKGTDLTVGDFVRAVRQLIDLLNQIAKASPELKDSCKAAVKRIDRGVVLDMVGAS